MTCQVCLSTLKADDLFCSSCGAAAPDHAAGLAPAVELPLVLKVGENVDNTHDLHVKTFAHKGHMHLGLHILCPNSSLK